jgi:Cdc6-like AAA superfamily ATPase
MLYTRRVRIYLAGRAPGTGKTVLMKFFITLLSSLSEQVGLRCVVRSLEASQVKSEWFGRSGRLVKEMTEAVVLHGPVGQERARRCDRQSERF